MKNNLNNRIHFGSSARLPGLLKMKQQLSAKPSLCSMLTLTSLFILSSFIGPQVLAQSTTIVFDEATFISLAGAYELESYEGTTLPDDFTIELAEDRIPHPNDQLWVAPAVPIDCIAEDGTQVLLFTNKVKLTFNAPITAFATYLIDLGDYGANSLEVKTSTGESWIAFPDGTGCSRIFTGIVAECQPFTWITLESLPAPNGDGIYLDKTYYTYANNGTDTDGDGVWNDCDEDADNDGIDDECDSNPLVNNFIYTGVENLPESWLCGNNNNKVLICHGANGNPAKAQTKCVSPNAVQAHLNHGDMLGECIPCGGSNERVNDKHAEMETEMEVFPNPARDVLNVHLHGADLHNAQIIIYDSIGKVVWQENLAEHPTTLKVNLSGSSFISGMYTVRMISEEETISKKIMISK